MSAPRVVVTGASRFVGRHLIDHLQDDYRIVGIARRSQRRAGIADDPNVTWLEADIAERARRGCDQTQETFEELSLRRVNFRLANADCRSVITN